ncbi:hypothetical protein WJX84_000010 [Apatococcus fuscideae]|uniref:Uncharacterized protein n=1 Tax=Apatococcus fuscideae TaxID=2026836 RepID=A0AAW1TB08_9CHLO
MSLGRKRRFLPEELSSIDAITRAVKRLHTSSPSVSSLAESTQAHSTGSMHAQSGLQETSMTQEADSMGGPMSEVDQPAAENQSRPPRHRNDSPLPPSPCGSLSRHLASRAARWRSQNRLRRSIGGMCLPEHPEAGMWDQEGMGMTNVGGDDWTLASGQVEPELPNGPRHEVDMAQVAVARHTGKEVE